MTDDYEFFIHKRPDRLYVSPTLEHKEFLPVTGAEPQEITRPFRIVSKVIDCREDHAFIKDGKEISLRITPGEREEIKAKFYEDTRGISTLVIQRYTKETGVPHKTHFAFVEEEIQTLYNFIRNVALIPLRSKDSFKVDDDFLESLVLSREQAIRLLQDQPELVTEILNSSISAQDITNLNYRKEQLKEFDKLLHDSAHFEKRRVALGKNTKQEAVWQEFFENNHWVFGYGLNYLFNSPLEDKRLEQVVAGSDFSSGGKRVDALLKTRGLISSLAFGEIKTHRTPLLSPSSTPYRVESWPASSELAGGIAQVQRAVQKSVENLLTRTDLKDCSGNLTGEQVFLYQPKSFLVIGSLSEFSTEKGINEEKFSSFELLRRNLSSPEIITFDELFERAKQILQTDSHSA